MPITLRTGNPMPPEAERQFLEEEERCVQDKPEGSGVIQLTAVVLLVCGGVALILRYIGDLF